MLKKKEKGNEEFRHWAFLDNFVYIFSDNCDICPWYSALNNVPKYYLKNKYSGLN